MRCDGRGRGNLGPLIRCRFLHYTTFRLPKPTTTSQHHTNTDHYAKHLGQTPSASFRMKGELLFHQAQVYLSATLRLTVLQQCHDTPSASHFGRRKHLISYNDGSGGSNTLKMSYPTCLPARSVQSKDDLEQAQRPSMTPVNTPTSLGPYLNRLPD